jgi:hypothetical protein
VAVPQTTPELAADVLATAVDKAIKLERERSERETELAVKAATEKANTQHQLNDHAARLNAVNGTIARTGTALIDLRNSMDTFHDKQEKRNEKWDTEQAVHWRRAGQAFSKRQVVAAYLTILVMAGGPVIAEVVKSVFG